MVRRGSYIWSSCKRRRELDRNLKEVNSDTKEPRVLLDDMTRNMLLTCAWRRDLIKLIDVNRKETELQVEVDQRMVQIYGMLDKSTKESEDAEQIRQEMVMLVFRLSERNQSLGKRISEDVADKYELVDNTAKKPRVLPDDMARHKLLTIARRLDMHNMINVNRKHVKLKIQIVQRMANIYDMLDKSTKQSDTAKQIRKEMEKIVLMMWVRNQSLRHRITEIVEQTYELAETLVIKHVDDTQHHTKTVVPTRMAKVCQTVKELHNIMLQKMSKIFTTQISNTKQNKETIHKQMLKFKATKRVIGVHKSQKIVRRKWLNKAILWQHVQHYIFQVYNNPNDEQFSVPGTTCTTVAGVQ